MAAPTTPRIPVVLCIDVEPDPRHVDRARPEPWRGFEVLYERITSARSRLARRAGTPVSFSWFLRMDPQIADTYGSPGWAVTHYAEELAALIRAGDELGLHTHAYRSDGNRGWITDDADQAWVDHCVRMSFAAFKEALGRDCRSFRFGDGWTNDATLSLIESLGARQDLTLEPGRRGVPASERHDAATGAIPDLATVPRCPYRRDPRDFRRPDPSGRAPLWMLPVSTASPGSWLAPALLVYRRIRRPTRRAESVTTLNLALRPALFRRVFDASLTRCEQPHVVMVIRPDPSRRHLRWLDRNLTCLLEHPRIDRMLFTSAAGAAAVLGSETAPDDASAHPEGREAPRSSL